MSQVSLPSKPSARLSYDLRTVPSESAANGPRLIVFLNNLLTPASSWEDTITELSTHRAPKLTNSRSTINILTYDRFGQGTTTDHDPLDSLPEAEPGYDHDFLDVVHDLHELISQVISTQPWLLLVAASIGAPLVRLYAETYPGSVASLILLDSNICNANYSSFWPDPSASDFNPEDVTAPDCTLEQYIEATKIQSGMFDLAVKNKEGLDRRTSAKLLPHADGPVLESPEGKMPKLCMVGHDPEAFAEEGLQKLRTPKSFTGRWTQVAWDRYNEGLLKIGHTREFPDVVIAKGCGHFIQKDDPDFVAEAVGKMLDVLGW